MFKLGNFVNHLFGVLMLLILLVSPLGVMPSHTTGIALIERLYLPGEEIF
jgi:hypothetical protein